MSHNLQLYASPQLLAKGAFLYNMFMRIWALALSFFILSCTFSSGFAATLGPAKNFNELRSLLADIKSGDTILISGDISAHEEPALSIPVSARIKSDGIAAISGLHLKDASVTFSDISITDTLTVSGTSHIYLGRNVSVTGSSGHAGLTFTGDGTLIVEGGCTIEGGQGADGISISHCGGEFFGSIEGTVRGGSGLTGGTGLVISPLQNNGAVMITGSIVGGNGSSMGGHALNLYELSGNAYITVDGHLHGGSGSIGGDGIQIVSACDNVNVGISGQAKGGSGENYGGDALILMNVQDASSFHISGHFSGGDAAGENAQPGTSIQLVGNAAVTRARIDNCILEDGKSFKPAPSPTTESTPAPTSQFPVEPFLET